MVPAAGGRLVRLDNVTELSAGKAPGQIDRYNREREITPDANSSRHTASLSRF